MSKTTDPTDPDAAEFKPNPNWRWNENGGWEEVARMRVGDYFARVEDQDGDSSTWSVCKDRVEIDGGQFYDNEPYHLDLALQAAETKLRELGAL